MIRSRRKTRVVSRGSRGYGGSQSRNQLGSSNSQSRSLVQNRPQQTQENNNFRDNAISFVGSQNQSKTFQEKHISGNTSSSEDDEFFHFSRLTHMRHLSDYETGEISDRTLRPRRVDTSKKYHKKTGATTTQQPLDSDSSSDDSVSRIRKVKKLKRPLSPSSSSDTSDSGIPIAYRGSVKRMKVLNSEESSSESVSEENYQNLRHDVSNISKKNMNKTEKLNTDEFQFAGSSTQETGEYSVFLAGPSVQRPRGSKIPLIESESESDLVSNNHIVRGRRIPVIESEEDSDSSVEHSSRSSRVSSFQRGSVLGVNKLSQKKRRNALTSQEVESIPTIIAGPVSSINTVRRGVRNMDPETARQNVSRSMAQPDETEDNSVPISIRRKVRGRRIPVVASDDDSESDTANNNEISISNDGNVDSSFRSEASNIRTITLPSNYERNAISYYNFRRRNFSSIQNEYESDSSDYDTRTRTISNRERGSTRNGAGTILSTHNDRRQVIGSDRNQESMGHNVWIVTAQAHETEGNNHLISNHHRLRGGRIPVVESDDDLESDAIRTNFTLNPEGIDIGSSFGSDVNNLRGRTEFNDDEINPLSNYNLRRGNIPSIQNENESNSSESDIRPRTLSNRIIPIFQSDDSLSTSSSSSMDSDDSIPIRNPRRNRPIPIVDDYEDIANNFSEYDVISRVPTGIKIFNNHDRQNGNSSDTDGESEKCPICLTGFKLQEIAKPKSCDHKFCSLCIKEWATKNNTCPVDRKSFDGIVIYDKIDGKIISELPIEKPNPQNDHEVDFGRIEEIVAELFTDSSEESSWYFNNSDGDGPEEICYMCGTSNQPHRMISCGSCDAVYHLGCVDPPLRDFPTVNWYCFNCEYRTDTFSDSD